MGHNCRKRQSPLRKTCYVCNTTTPWPSVQNSRRSGTSSTLTPHTKNSNITHQQQLRIVAAGYHKAIAKKFISQRRSMLSTLTPHTKNSNMTHQQQLRIVAAGYHKTMAHQAYQAAPAKDLCLKLLLEGIQCCVLHKHTHIYTTP